MWHFVIDTTASSANPAACSCLQTHGRHCPLCPVWLFLHHAMWTVKTVDEYFEVHLFRMQHILLVGHQVLNIRVSLRLCFVPSVIRSTLVPICSSRQRHDPHKIEGIPSSQTWRRRNHLDSPDSRRSKRRLADDGLEATSASPTASLSAEELFKLKNSGEFDINDEEKDKHVEVKDEPTGDSGQTSHAPKQLSSMTVPPTAPAHHARSLSVHSPVRTVFGDHSTQIVNREDLLDNLLSQNFSTEMTGYAVQQILQDAKESTGAGNELGVACVEVRINRLQQKGVASARLDEVVQLFQKSLRDDLVQLSSRIESIGGISTPPNTSSAGTTPHAPDEDKHLRVHSNSSAKRPQRDTIVAKAAQKPAVNRPRTQLAAFEASHPQSDSSDSSSNDDDNDNEGNCGKSKECNSRDLADDDDNYRDDLDGDRSELTEEERSMLVAYPFYSAFLDLLTHSTRSEYNQAKGQSPAIWLSKAKSCIRHICPLRDLSMHVWAWRCQHCHGYP